MSSQGVPPEAIEFESEGRLLKGSLFMADERPGSAVILCHGAFEHRLNWSEYAARLAESGCSTLTFDFAGHGESAGLRSLVDMPVWAYNLRDAMNYLARRGFLRFALVGWDFGGSAVLLAAAHDPRIACCVTLAAPVLVNPPLADRLAFMLASGAGWLWRKVLHRPLTLNRLAELEKKQAAVDPQANERFYADPEVRQLLRAVPVPDSLHSAWVDITPAVEKIQAPVLVLHGERDHLVPIRQSELLHDRLTGRKEFHRLANSGHILHFDQTKEQVLDKIIQWVKQYL